MVDASHSYVPAGLLDSLVGQPSRIAPWVDEIHGTLVMADVSGFTAMSERLAAAGKEGAEWLTDVINRFFTQMLEIAASRGGDTLTFGGDAILLLFSGEAHADRAVAASLAMLDAAERLPAFRVRGKPIKLGMSMGAHSGVVYLVAAGVPGQRMQYMPLGPATRLTAEAEAAADRGELVVSSETVAILEGAPELEERNERFRVVSFQRAGEAGEWANSGSAAAVPTAVPSALESFLPPRAARNADPEHRPVTIAFVNVTGVERVLAERGAAALAGETNRIVSAAVRLLVMHSGFLVSSDIYTEGFKLIVAFGAPTAIEAQEASALRFANDLRCEVAALETPLRMRIGINAGPVFAADAGAPFRRQYTVMGDAVNLAARLMSAAAEGEVIVSAYVATAAGQGFECSEREAIRVKGKHEPVSICELVGTCADDEVAATPRALIGRERELSSAMEAARSCEASSGRTVWLVGEAGIGKSRLAAEIVSLLEARGWQVRCSTARSHLRAQPFSVWLDLLTQLFEIGTDMSPTERGAAIVHAVERLAPESTEFAGLVGPLFDAPVPGSRIVASLNERARRRKLLELLSAVVLARARECGPLLVELEDVHWADSSSRALVELLAIENSGDPLMMLLTQRPAARSELRLPERSTVRIDLCELARPDAVRLMAAELGVEALSNDAADVLLSKSHGNPLYVQELAQSLGERGLVADLAKAQGARLKRLLASAEIPDRVQPIIMSRIDSLDPDAKRFLRAAAVVGVEFDTDLAAVALGDHAVNVKPIMAVLEHSALVERAPKAPSRGPSRYRFHHGLVQEVAYDSMAFALRRAAHQRVGVWFEHLHAVDSTAVAETLAHHFSLAGNATKTRQYAVVAAEKARGLYAHDEAVGFYGMALDATKAATAAGALSRSLLFEHVGDAHEAAGHHISAIAAYRQALTRWQRLRPGEREGEPLASALSRPSNPRARAAALAYRATVSAERASTDYAAAVRWSDRALALLPRGETELRSRICVAKSVALFRQARYQEAVDWGRRGLRLARRVGGDRLQAYALDTLASPYLELGDLRQAVRLDGEAVGLYERTSDLAGLAVASGNLATGYQLLGMLEEALGEHQRALTLYERLGNETETAIAHANIGEIELERGELAEAIHHLEASIATCRAECAGTDLEGFALLNLARAYRGSGRVAESREALAAAMAILERTGAQGLLLEASIDLALATLKDGDCVAATSLASNALRATQERGMRLLECRAERVLGQCAAELRDLAGAATHLRRSVEIARQIGADAELARGLDALDALGEAPARGATKP